MLGNMRSSSVFISIRDTVVNLDERASGKIEEVFYELFSEEDSKGYKRVSDTTVAEVREIIYEILTPVLKDDGLNVDFYENLEVLLEELSEYNAHFTQFDDRRVDN